jgi:predicted ATP-dependent endonuclease of OLD family
MTTEEKNIRLAKVAKETSLSIKTLVNALVNNGMPIDNNPNAKISEKEYQFLLNYFRVSQTQNSNIDKKSFISFKNFRRFKVFEPLEYKGITFLVGRNNSGKSTLVKALLLIDNYFKSGQIDSFSFGNNVLEDANIVTYGRAKNHQADENFIQFTQKIENYLIDLTITGEDDRSIAIVHTLTVTDTDYKLNFIFNIQNRFLRITKNWDMPINIVYEKVILDLETKLSETKKQLAEQGLKKTSKEYIELISKIENLETKLDDIKEDSNVEDANYEFMFSIDEDFGTANSLTEIVQNFIQQSVFAYEREFRNVQNGEPASERFEDLEMLKKKADSVEESFRHFMMLMKDFSIAYMGANPTKQSALFAIRDKNNALAQAIHEYKQLNILEGEEEHRFVLKWMQVFEVGDDFTISMHGGEAYELKIVSHNTITHLADKGMGSIQAMLLIFRMACIIRKLKLDKNRISQSTVFTANQLINFVSNFRVIEKTTVIIEEPELNLHPALQSKLADLFLDVHLQYNIDFLIETHSEYILRRSQVIVAENEYEVAPNENPFCVHYFPKEYDQFPYQLKYQPDGTFDKNFETGFFDTASLDTLKLLRIKREKKA